MASASAPPGTTPPAPFPGIPQLAPEYATLISQMGAALRIARVAVGDWMVTTAPDHCNATRLAQARQRLDEHGTLFYIATVSDAIHHALHGAPVAFDPDHRDALLWRAFCALPQAARLQLVAANAPSTQLDAAMFQTAGSPQ